MDKILFGKVTMVLEWWEREHEDIDHVSIGDPMTINALRRFVFLKFYGMSNMQAQVRLMETLVNLWDHDLGFFNLQGKTLELTTEDACFLMSLSQRGAPVNMAGTGQGGDHISVQYYINT